MRTYKSLRWFVAVPLAVATTALLGASKSEPPRACEVAAAWVVSHSNSLPQTLSAFHAFPMEYQLAIYGQLSSETRIAMWKEKLDAYLLPTSGLTKEQRAVVVEFYNNLPSYVADQSGAKGREAIRKSGILDRAQAAFGKQASAVFDIMQRSGDSGSSLLRSPGGPAAATAVNAELGWCQCNRDDPIDPHCDLAQNCFADDGCLQSHIGCGFGNDDPCDGICL